MLCESSANAAMLEQEELQELAAALEHWQDHPADFVRDVIGAEPDEWQVSALSDLRHSGRVSIAACHGPGKDALAAWALLWCLICWEHPKCPCTAPTSHQLRDLLWSEVAKWKAQMLPFFAVMLEVKKDRIEYTESADTWFAAARTARKENSEALQGFHAEVILVIVDEASGVPMVIFEVLEGAMTGPFAMMLLIGNPTQTSGYFYESHHSDRERWRVYRVMAGAAHDGTTLPEGVFASQRVSSEYVSNIFKKYGRDSNVARVRVFGLFPKSEADQTIPLEWVEMARARELPKEWKPRHYPVLGVDVARFGADDSALVCRRGPAILDLETWHGHDEDFTANRVLTTCKLMATKGEKPRYVFVDGCGIGAGVIKRLRKNDDKGHNWLRDNGITVIDVQAGASSPDPECELLRDALWWRGRKSFDPMGGGDRLGGLPMFRAGLDLELVGRLTGELASPKYGYSTRSQKLKIESKDDMKDRGLGSPDLADAFLLTLFFEAGMPEPKPEPARHEVAPKTSRFGK